MTEHIDISNIVRQVLRQWLVLLLLGVIAASGAGIAASRMYQPHYESEALIVVYEKGSATSGVKSASTTADLFQEVITSSLLQKKVAEILGISYLPGTISCENIPNTNMILLKARASTPKDVMIVLNGVLDHYKEATSGLLDGVILQVLEEPKVPMEPVDAYDEGRLLKKAFLGTVAAAAAAMFLYFYFRDDVKNEEEVERKLDTKLFGTIYHENLEKGFFRKHRGEKTALLVNNPVASFGYIETFQKLCVKLEHKLKKSESKVILVTSVLESEGKSTVASNLALSLAKRGKKVLLVDLDLRKPAQAMLFGQSYAKTVPQVRGVLAGKDSFEEAVRTVKGTSLSLLAGSKSSKNSTRLIVNSRFAAVFAEWKASAEYVILDTPPLQYVADAEELMRYADAGLLVVRQNCSKTKDINDAIDVFPKMGCELLGCILNDVKTGLLGDVISKGDDYRYKYGYGYGYYHKKRASEENTDQES